MQLCERAWRLQAEHMFAVARASLRFLKIFRIFYGIGIGEEEILKYLKANLANANRRIPDSDPHSSTTLAHMLLRVAAKPYSRRDNYERCLLKRICIH